MEIPKYPKLIQIGLQTQNDWKDKEPTMDLAPGCQGCTVNMPRLESFASENVILEQIECAFLQTRPEQQSPITALSQSRSSRSLLLWIYLKCVLPWNLFNGEIATNPQNFDQSHGQKACSPTGPWALGPPWRCHTYSMCKAQGQTTKLPPLHRAGDWRAMVSNCKPRDSKNLTSSCK